MKNELLFKRKVYNVKSKNELKNVLMEFWNLMEVGDVIKLNTIAGKPKLLKMVNEIMMKMHQKYIIHATWIEKESIIRKEWK
ncbi:MAG TPA: hypothetical protein PKN54_05070 [Candidatus Cloacimonas acidaminovorans]|jgi:phosphoribosylaminoimidazole-succinocarboxamide synthase|nr:hypothetical protein [Candidatus Cloacimonas acidaminovorans]